MSNLPSNSLQEGEHNLQEMKTKSPAWSLKGYHMYEHYLHIMKFFVVVVALLFYVHGKHLRSCRDGQLT